MVEILGPARVAAHGLGKTAAMLSNSVNAGRRENQGFRNFRRCACVIGHGASWHEDIVGLIRIFVPLLIAISAISIASAQNAAPQDTTAGRFDPTPAQRQVIYQSISKAQKNNAAPTGFRATVGAVVPNGVMLAPLPATIVELVPRTKGLESALVEGEVVLVEPEGRRVVAVIVQEPQAAR